MGFTSWTTDVPAAVTVTNNSIILDELDANFCTAYVYKDFGVDNFDTFSHFYTFVMDARSTEEDPPGIAVAEYSNVVEDYKDSDTSRSEASFVICNWANTDFKLTVQDTEDPIGDSSIALDFDTQYWLTISRTADNFVCVIYDDEDRTSEVDTISVPRVEAGVDYRYAWALNTSSWAACEGSPVRWWSGTLAFSEFVDQSSFSSSQKSSFSSSQKSSMSSSQKSSMSSSQPSSAVPTCVDYTGFVETDPFNYLTVNADSIVAANWDTQGETYVVKDYGADYFKNFRHQFSINIDTWSGSGTTAAWWAVGNSDDADLIDCWVGELEFLHVGTYIGTSNIFIRNSKTQTQDAYLGISLDTEYYITVSRYSLLATAIIYSDAEKTDVIDTISVAVGQGDSYRYLYGAQSDGNPLNPLISGTVTCLQIEGLADTSSSSQSSSKSSSQKSSMSSSMSSSQPSSFSSSQKSSMSSSQSSGWCRWTEVDNEDAIDWPQDTHTLQMVDYRTSGEFIDYVSGDFGAGNIGTSFTYDVDIYVDSITLDQCMPACFMVADVDGKGHQDIRDDDDDGWFCYPYGHPGGRWISTRGVSGAVESTESYQSMVEDTWYYLTFTRAAANCTVQIYSDTGRSVLVDTLSVTVGVTDTYQYYYAVTPRDSTDSASTREFTGTFVHKDVNFDPCIPSQSSSQKSSMSSQMSSESSSHIPCGLDLTTFTKVDPNSDMTFPRDDHVAVETMTLDVDAYLYKDYGAGYFTDFTHTADIRCRYQTGSPGIVIAWAVANTIDDACAWINNENEAIWVYWLGTTPNIYLRDWDSFDGTAAGISLNTWYYIQVDREDTTTTCVIYDDEARTSVVDTLILANGSYSLRYLFAVNSFDYDDEARWTSCDTKCLNDITPTESSSQSSSQKSSMSSSQPSSFSSSESSSQTPTCLNYFTFTEVDPDGDITIAENTIVTDALDVTTVTSYVYKDYGAAFFNDFVHETTINVEVFSFNPTLMGFWAVGNMIGDVTDLAGDTALFLFANFSPYQFFIRRRIPGLQQDASANFSLNTDYYFTITRSGDDCTVVIYTDALKTAIFDTISVNGIAGDDYRYLYALQSDDYGGAEGNATATIGCLDIGLSQSSSKSSSQLSSMSSSQKSSMSSSRSSSEKSSMSSSQPSSFSSSQKSSMSSSQPSSFSSSQKSSMSSSQKSSMSSSQPSSFSSSQPSSFSSSQKSSMSSSQKSSMSSSQKSSMSSSQESSQSSSQASSQSSSQQPPDGAGTKLDLFTAIKMLISRVGFAQTQKLFPHIDLRTFLEDYEDEEIDRVIREEEDEIKRVLENVYKAVEAATPEVKAEDDPVEAPGYRPIEYKDGMRVMRTSREETQPNLDAMRHMRLRREDLMDFDDEVDHTKLPFMRIRRGQEDNR